MTKSHETTKHIILQRTSIYQYPCARGITAGLTGEQQRYRNPTAGGAGIGLAATLAIWCIAVPILDDISEKVSAKSPYTGLVFGDFTMAARGRTWWNASFVIRAENWLRRGVLRIVQELITAVP